MISSVRNSQLMISGRLILTLANKSKTLYNNVDTKYIHTFNPKYIKLNYALHGCISWRMYGIARVERRSTCGEPNSVKKESYSLPFTDVFPGVCMVSQELKEDPHDSLSFNSSVRNSQPIISGCLILTLAKEFKTL